MVNPVSQYVPAVAPRTTVITAEPQAQEVADQQQVGPGPIGLTCTSCNKPIITRVKYSATCHTHIVATALCVVFGCCCGCCIPHCMKSCKVVKHYCPECYAFLGTFVPT